MRYEGENSKMALFAIRLLSNCSKYLSISLTQACFKSLSKAHNRLADGSFPHVLIRTLSATQLFLFFRNFVSDNFSACFSLGMF